MNFPIYLRIFLLLMVWNAGTMVVAQEPIIIPDIVISEDKKTNNTFSFQLRNTPELKQISGAPKAHYGFFWEFGDGNYSTEENPTHTYNDKKKGKVKVSLTNNYGSGGAPRLKSKDRLEFQKMSQSESPKGKWKSAKKKSSPLASNEAIHLFNNHSPRPGDPMVSVLSYQNTDNSQASLNGTLYFFYNEKSFKNNNFNFVASRYHANERFTEGFPTNQLAYLMPETTLKTSTANGFQQNHLPVHLHQSLDYWSANPQYIPGGKSDQALSSAKKQYKNVLSWRFENLTPGEKRNIFTSLETTPDMIKDTTATITYKGIMVPDFKDEPKEFTLKMTIQSSHDPNKMFVSHKKISKRLIKSDGITYTIKFQNVGRGAASNILIENKLAEALDPNSIKIKNIYPKANICPINDSAFVESCMDTTRIGQLVKWQFKNIYLPGTRQKDKENRKSTKGYIEFEVKPKEKFKKKQTLGTRAYIYFDRNDPVKTNKVRTKILKSTAWGVRGGFNNFSENKDDVFISVFSSPFQPRGIYYQPEFGISRVSYFSIDETFSGVLFTNANGASFTGTSIDRHEVISTFFDIVPLQFRINVASFLSIGAGMQVSVLLSAKERDLFSVMYDPVNGQVPFDPTNRESENTLFAFSGQKDDRFNNVEAGFFFDAAIGLVKKGPSMGIRYINRNGKRIENREASEASNHQYLQLYANFKF